MMDELRELDVQVAEVLGWIWDTDPDTGDRALLGPELGTDSEYVRSYWPTRSDSGELPHYSTDIAAAWELVTSTKREITIRHLGVRWYMLFEGSELYSDAPTAPEAICRAFLAAVGQTPPAKEG
jgi:hypothetical protein